MYSSIHTLLQVSTRTKDLVIHRVSQTTYDGAIARAERRLELGEESHRKLRRYSGVVEAARLEKVHCVALLMSSVRGKREERGGCVR